MSPNSHHSRASPWPEVLTTTDVMDDPDHKVGQFESESTVARRGLPLFIFVIMSYL